MKINRCSIAEYNGGSSKEMIRDINSLGRVREREETKLWLGWRNVTEE